MAHMIPSIYAAMGMLRSGASLRAQAIEYQQRMQQELVHASMFNAYYGAKARAAESHAPKRSCQSCGAPPSHAASCDYCGRAR